MKCYNCGGATRTEYPKVDGIQYVRKKCVVCGWKSYPTEVIAIKKLDTANSRDATLHFKTQEMNE